MSDSSGPSAMKAIFFVFIPDSLVDKNSLKSTFKQQTPQLTRFVIFVCLGINSGDINIEST